MALDTTVEQVDGDPPLTVLALAGELDASNFASLVAEVQGLYAAGTRRLLLDLTDLRFMASSGLVALHSIVRILQGEAPDDLEAGWGSFHTVGHDVAGGRDPDGGPAVRGAARGPARARPDRSGPTVRHPSGSRRRDRCRLTGPTGPPMTPRRHLADLDLRSILAPFDDLAGRVAISIEDHDGRCLSMTAPAAHPEACVSRSADVQVHDEVAGRVVLTGPSREGPLLGATAGAIASALSIAVAAEIDPQPAPRPPSSRRSWPTVDACSAASCRSCPRTCPATTSPPTTRPRARSAATSSTCSACVAAAGR